MKVTKVFLKENPKSGALKYFVDVEIDNVAKLTGFKIFETEQYGRGIGLPNKKDEKGKKGEKGKDVYYPLFSFLESEDGAATYEQFKTAILEAAAVQENKPVKPTVKKSAKVKDPFEE